MVRVSIIVAVPHSCRSSAPPPLPGGGRPLGRSREQRCQPLQIEQPAHQLRVVSDLQKPPPLKTTEAMPTFRRAPECFDLLPRPWREAGTRCPAPPSHPLMHRLSSRRFGGNGRPATPPEAGRQNLRGKIALVRASRVTAKWTLYSSKFLIGKISFSIIVIVGPPLVVAGSSD
jgi:hypothetical protein